ncbi:MAG: hypothetical protein DMG33_12835, partial [Acidobacteria bacterium]
TIDVAKSPEEILVRSDRPIAYVSCSAAGKVAVIHFDTWKVDKLIDAGPSPDGLAWSAKQ